MHRREGFGPAIATVEVNVGYGFFSAACLRRATLAALPSTGFRIGCYYALLCLFDLGRSPSLPPLALRGSRAFTAVCIIEVAADAAILLRLAPAAEYPHFRHYFRNRHTTKVLLGPRR